MTKIVTNSSSGVVENPGLHDSQIVGVIFEQPNTIEVRFKTLSGNITRIRFDEVLGMVANSLFENNIVFEVRISPVTEGCVEQIQNCMHMPSAKPLDKMLLSKLISERFKFVEIDPTLGAEMQILCREITAL